MSFFPPPVIAAAIIAATIMPAVLVLLGRGPPRWRRPGARFKMSVTISWLTWGAIALIIAGLGIGQPLDWLAGAAVLLGMTLTMFVVWSLIVWGFTMNLLLILAHSERPLDLNAWAELYSGGASIEQICLDRLRILLMFGLAHCDGDLVRLNPGFGRLVAAALTATHFLFGSPRPR